MGSNFSDNIRETVIAAPEAFEISDFHPRKLALLQKAEKSSRAASVFIPGSDWASSHFIAVLDALQDLSASEAKESQDAKAQLPFLRKAGTMMIDGACADLFETENVRSKSKIVSKNLHVIECAHCHRPLLPTRFLTHLKVCANSPNFKKSGSGEYSPLLAETCSEFNSGDGDMALVLAPYDRKSSGRASTLEKYPERISSLEMKRVVKNSKQPFFPGTRADVLKLRKSSTTWRKKLSPLAPLSKTRSSRIKLSRRSPLLPLGEPSVKKKVSASERRSLAAATSVGIETSLGEGTKQEDYLKAFASTWGSKLPWGKIAQLSRPLLLSRTGGKSSNGREPHVVHAGNEPPSLPRTTIQNSGKPTKNPDNSNEKCINGASSVPPSLSGALLWLRGKGLAPLQNTALNSLDIVSSSVPRNSLSFNGQFYVASLGTYMSDPRSPRDIRLPSSLSETPVDALSHPQQMPSSVARPAQTRPDTSPRTSAAESGTPQPPFKRQRTIKQQPRTVIQNPQGPPTATVAPPKGPPNVSRKVATPRIGVSGVQPTQKLQMSQKLQQLPQHRASLPATSGLSNSSVSAGAGAVIAAGETRSPAQVSHLKRQHRSPSQMPVVNGVTPSSAMQSAAQVPSKASVITSNSSVGKPTIRGGKARPSSMPVTAASAGQKLLHQGKVGPGPLQQQAVSAVNRSNPITAARNNPLGTPDIGAILSGHVIAAGVNGAIPQPGSGLSTQEQFAQVLSIGANQRQEEKRAAVRSPGAGRLPQRPGIPGIRDAAAAAARQQRQGAGQAPWVVAQLGHQQALPPEALRRQAQSQPRQREALGLAASHRPTAGKGPGAMNARQVPQVPNPAQIYTARQVAPSVGNVGAMSNMYNPGFSVAMQSHDRAPMSVQVPQTASAAMGTNAATNLQFMRMVPPSQAFMNPMPGGGANRSGMQGLQDPRVQAAFGAAQGVQGLGNQNNALNFLQAAGLGGVGSSNAPMNQNFGMPMGRMDSRTQMSIMQSNEAVLQQLLSSSQPLPHTGLMHGGHPNAVVNAQANLLSATVGVGGNENAQAPKADLDAIDRALSSAFDNDLLG